MWPEQFQFLVNLLQPRLQKRSIRTPLPTDLRLAVTLLYLAQGDSAKLKHAEFRIGKSTVHSIIHETCHAIWDELHPIVLKAPDKNMWKHVSDGFMQYWQFPNCIGAMDGRHMRVQAPPNSGSMFFNYKQFFSIVLLAACDAKYKFIWVDIGQFGSISDGGVWANTQIAQDLEDGNLNLPDPSPLPGTDRPFPYVFVADEAFPLGEHLMRPYPRKELSDEKRVFNYRLSRARRTIENTFGILTARWRILHKPLQMLPKNCDNVFKALVCLHNFIMLSEEDKNANDRRYCGRDFIDEETENGSVTEGQWRRECSPHFLELGRLGANRAGALAKGLRVYLTEYFSTIGEEQAPWQYEYAFRGANLNPPAF